MVKTALFQPGLQAHMDVKIGLGRFEDPERNTRWNAMSKIFKIGDHVRWNSEAGRVDGKIVRVHTRNFEVNGYTHHASAVKPQYEIKSSRTEHIAFHKGSALTKVS
jgi:hypothetical protein